MNINIIDTLINLIIIEINKKHSTIYTRDDINAINFYVGFISIYLPNKHYRINIDLNLKNMNVEQVL